jgi:hypothetical protein
MVTVAGLCRTLTGFAAAQCVVEEDDRRRLALAPRVSGDAAAPR